MSEFQEIYIVTAGDRENYCIVAVFADENMAHDCVRENRGNMGNLVFRVEDWDMLVRSSKEIEMDNQEKKTEENKWEPKTGDNVVNPQDGRIGKVIGVQPPGMVVQGEGWQVLVKWEDNNLSDTWHDASDLEFDKAEAFNGIEDEPAKPSQVDPD